MPMKYKVIKTTANGNEVESREFECTEEEWAMINKQPSDDVRVEPVKEKRNGQKHNS